MPQTPAAACCPRSQAQQPSAQPLSAEGLETLLENKFSTLQSTLLLKVATKEDLKGEINSLRTDGKGEINSLRTELKDRTKSINDTVNRSFGLLGLAAVATGAAGFLCSLK